MACMRLTPYSVELVFRPVPADNRRADAPAPGAGMDWPTVYRRCHDAVANQTMALRSAPPRSELRDLVCLFLAVAALLSAVGAGLAPRARGAVHATTAPVSSTFVLVTVRHGDSLWKFAKLYRASDDYVLESIDQIAQDNGIDPRGSLTPGQQLRIRVDPSGAVP
ncbi:MAG: LysM peptidoglycan-binding domain-containing protein [Capsulimonadaceae bacterium]